MRGETRLPIDFDRYPMDRPDDEKFKSKIDKARNHLKTHQYCSLPGLLRAEALPDVVADVSALVARAHVNEHRRTCYLTRVPDPSRPADHPANLMKRGRYRMIAADLMSPASALKQLYYFEPFRRMVEQITGSATLYPNEDPLQPVNVICHEEGDESGWHYDSGNAFTMTLMLQAPRAGGVFEIAPNTRDGVENEDIPYMTEVLTGARERVRSISRSPGELTIFRGCNSLHRVSPVEGNRPRLMCVMVYENAPGYIGDPVVNMTVYGRTGREALME